jgi:hypothetical protein
LQSEKEWGSSHVRKVRYREKGVLVEDITLDESLQQFPRHRAAELKTTEYDKRPAASMILNIHSYEMKKKAASPTMGVWEQGKLEE